MYHVCFGSGGRRRAVGKPLPWAWFLLDGDDEASNV